MAAGLFALLQQVMEQVGEALAQIRHLPHFPLRTQLVCLLQDRVIFVILLARGVHLAKITADALDNFL